MMVKCYFTRVIALLGMMLVIVGVSGCGRSKQQDVVTPTQLDQLLDGELNTIPAVCQQTLQSIGRELIGKKIHFLHPTVDSDNHIDSQVTRITGTLLYNDRPSHIQFDVEPAINTNGCTVRYDLSYQLDIPCLTAREEAFKKWLHLGKLGGTTQYYVHKRHPNKIAYLTNISRNLQCLVNVQVVESSMTTKKIK